MKRWMFLSLVFLGCRVCSQPIKQRLALAVQQLEADTQLQHAIIGFCVTDSKADTIVYEHNAQAGLAPASTQKIFTSCAAFDLLGKNYRYTTDITYKFCNPSPARSYFVIKPSGDPTFGSPRFASTRASAILTNIITALKAKRITPVSSQYMVNDSAYASNAVPGGWIWEDIGNYYGAAAQGLNWMENEYNIILASGKKVGDPVAAVGSEPQGLISNLRVNLKSAEKGSGDNSIVFLPYNTATPEIAGTIPAGEDSFAVAASISNPQEMFIQQLNETMKAAQVPMFYGFGSHPPSLSLPDSLFDFINLYRQVSPPLDTINYWFLQKSINLYGEALMKTMAVQKTGIGSTEQGVALLKDFWSDHNIEPSALHICDGSGLSPQNRVTANALVKALQYARTRPWFSSFYHALPLHNEMKMKSGTIGGVKAYAGYQAAKDGHTYSFAIIVNNYDGKSADLVKKLYALLDNLK